MNTNELIDYIVAQTGVTRADVRDTLDCMAVAAVATLKRNGTFKLNKIGVLSVTRRSARMARNPRTKEVISIRARKYVKISMSKLMRESIN